MEPVTNMSLRDQLNHIESVTTPRVILPISRYMKARIAAIRDNTQEIERVERIPEPGGFFAGEHANTIEGSTVTIYNPAYPKSNFPEDINLMNVTDDSISIMAVGGEEVYYDHYLNVNSDDFRKLSVGERVENVDPKRLEDRFEDCTKIIVAVREGEDTETQRNEIHLQMQRIIADLGVNSIQSIEVVTLPKDYDTILIEDGKIVASGSDTMQEIFTRAEPDKVIKIDDNISYRIPGKHPTIETFTHLNKAVSDAGYKEDKEKNLATAVLSDGSEVMIGGDYSYNNAERGITTHLAGTLVGIIPTNAEGKGVGCLHCSTEQLLEMITGGKNLRGRKRKINMDSFMGDLKSTKKVTVVTCFGNPESEYAQGEIRRMHDNLTEAFTLAGLGVAPQIDIVCMEDYMFSLLMDRGDVKAWGNNRFATIL